MDLGSVKGDNGTVVAYDEYIEIKRPWYNSTGNKVFFYKDITAVDYLRPEEFNGGYLHFRTPGSNTVAPKLSIAWQFDRSSRNAVMNNENCVLLKSGKANETDAFYSLIMKKIQESKLKSSSSTLASDPVDILKKYKELLDMCIITQEEFDIKKKQILGIPITKTESPIVQSDRNQKNFSISDQILDRNNSVLMHESICSSDSKIEKDSEKEKKCGN